MAGLKVPEVHKCCCCASLKTGTLIIGYLQVIVAFLALIIIIIASLSASDETIKEIMKSPDYAMIPGHSQHHDMDHDMDKDKQKKAFYVSQVGSGIGYVIAIVLASLLIIGVSKNKPGLLTPWLVVEVIGMVGIIVSFFGTLFLGLPPAGILVILVLLSIALAWSFYFFLIVYNYQKEMRGQAREILNGNVSKQDKYEIA